MIHARIEQVAPLSAAKESWAVARAAFAVVAVGLALIHAGRPDAKPVGGLPPFTALASTLDASGQRMFRAVAEALPEIEALRVERGAWPDPAALSELTAFSRPEYRWSLIVEGANASYLADGPRPFAIQLKEPTGESEVVIDETHHRLPDGRVVHVGIWSKPTGPASMPVLDRPMLDGWIQYLAKEPKR